MHTVKSKGLLKESIRKGKTMTKIRVPEETIGKLFIGEYLLPGSIQIKYDLLFLRLSLGSKEDAKPLQDQGL